MIVLKENNYFCVTFKFQLALMPVDLVNMLTEC